MNSFTAMDQVGKYWGIWGASTRRSSSTAAAAASPFPAAAWATQAGSEPSWEERAFARDAAEHLGGCVWPPRSYSCTFCHREFRSAQALGGHMNVHRRDRALLRQGGSSPEDQPQPQQSGALLYRAASNPSTTTTAAAAADKGIITPPPTSFLSTIIKESKNKLLMSSSMDQYGDFDDSNDGEESARGIKRRRLDHPSPATAALLIFVQPMATAVTEVKACESSQGLLQGLPLDHHDANNKVPQSSTSPNTSSSPDQQEVDLELRLGTTPKVT
ncbi:hypothetical protein HU200_066089 [Digitaria exilis]|uniref:C2H2-type domain-containing protein n=1 Tax=Digitaria exilis TaxID=1010633 RepID=A0A835A1P1_9POAL|nr:hypothetical protein HU200_066089 [Digitaria exilis]